MNEEEIAALQEELAEARAELERIEAEAADREARAGHFESELAQARNDIARLESEASSREATLAEQGRASAARYRELALAQAPELPTDLVAGDSIDEVEASLERARETVANVRRLIESEAQASRVPAGAPERGAPDSSGLSAEEKIRAGLSSRQ
jgi:hypothetical protein